RGPSHLTQSIDGIGDAPVRKVGKRAKGMNPITVVPENGLLGRIGGAGDLAGVVNGIGDAIFQPDKAEVDHVAGRAVWGIRGPSERMAEERHREADHHPSIVDSVGLGLIAEKGCRAGRAVWGIRGPEVGIAWRWG